MTANTVTISIFRVLWQNNEFPPQFDKLVSCGSRAQRGVCNHRLCPLHRRRWRLAGCHDTSTKLKTLPICINVAEIKIRELLSSTNNDLLLLHFGTFHSARDSLVVPVITKCLPFKLRFMLFLYLVKPIKIC